MRARTRAPGEREVPHAVQRLVPHELVGPAQRVLDDAVVVEHDGVLASTRPGSAPSRAARSTSRTNPNVRAGASSRANSSGVTRTGVRWRPISGCGKSIVTSSSSVSDGRASYTDSPSTTRTGAASARYCAAARAARAIPALAQRVEERRRAAVHDRRLRPVESRSRGRRSRAPATAASTCSTVCTAFGSSPSCVRRSVSTACSRQRGNRRRRRAGRAARTGCPRRSAPAGTSSVHGTPRCSPTPVDASPAARSCAASALVVPLALDAVARAPGCSDGSLNIAACARSASLCGRAG